MLHNRRIVLLLDISPKGENLSRHNIISTDIKTPNGVFLEYHVSLK